MEEERDIEDLDAGLHVEHEEEYEETDEEHGENEEHSGEHEEDYDEEYDDESDEESDEESDGDYESRQVRREKKLEGIIRETPTPANYAILIDHFLDFLTVSIHTILYERGLYHKESFISARKYNYPVRQSRHPDVCDWIDDAVDHIKKELLQCSIDNVSLVIFSSQDEPMERFVFDLSSFPVVDMAELQAKLAEDGKEKGGEGDDDEDDEPIRQPLSEEVRLQLVNMDEQFRAIMSKLAFCHQRLEALPEGCTFSMAIELRGDALAPINHPQPWIPVTTSLQVEYERDSNTALIGDDVGGVTTTPIRSVEAGVMSFEMWIEEGQSKFKVLGKPLEEKDNGPVQEEPQSSDKGPQSGGKFFAGESKVVHHAAKSKIEIVVHPPPVSVEVIDEKG